MRQITLPEALKKLEEIETTYQTLWRFMVVDSKTRKHLRYGAAQAHDIKKMVCAQERKTIHAKSK